MKVSRVIFESIAGTTSVGMGSRLLSRCCRPSKGRVLDAACGAGVYSEWLLSHGAEVIALDASPKMIELAKQRVGEALRCAAGRFELATNVSGKRIFRCRVEFADYGIQKTLKKQIRSIIRNCCSNRVSSAYVLRSVRYTYNAYSAWDRLEVSDECFEGYKYRKLRGRYFAR